MDQKLRIRLLILAALVTAGWLVVSRISQDKPIPRPIAMAPTPLPAPSKQPRTDQDVAQDSTCAGPTVVHTSTQRDNPRLEVIDSQVVLRLPETMQAALLACERTFRPWALNEYEAWVLEGYKTHLSERAYPSTVIGDFNGDGTLDLVADGRTSTKGMLLVIVSDTNRYKIVKLRTYALPVDTSRNPGHYSGPLGRNEQYLVPVHPRDVDLPVHPTDSPGVVRLTTDAFEMVYEEKGSALCFYQDGHFVWATTGD